MSRSFKEEFKFKVDLGNRHTANAVSEEGNPQRDETFP